MNILDVITASEAAEMKGVSVQWIRKLCADGKLNSRKSSDGVWLILKSSIKQGGEQ